MHCNLFFSEIYVEVGIVLRSRCLGYAHGYSGGARRQLSDSETSDSDSAADADAEQEQPQEQDVGEGDGEAT